jgi:four helix bundle protein
MARAKHVTELVCWQLAHELKVGVYLVGQRPHIRCDRKFHAQIVDAASSATSHISEGFGRQTKAEFARFLDISGASLTALQHRLIEGVDRGYLTEQESARLIILAKRSCSAVAALQRSLRGRGRLESGRANP